MKKLKIAFSTIIIVMAVMFVLPLFGNVAKDSGVVLTASAASTEKSGKCGDNVSWKLDSNGTLTISGSGEMYDYEYDRKSPFYYNSNIKIVVIEKGVISIGDYAFKDCDSLTSITIPNSVTSIGDYAFVDCDSLTSITIPNSVTSIGDSAFSGCDSLTSVTIPNSVASIGESAFYYCKSLTSVVIPNSVTSIGRNAFVDCSSLVSITIPNSVTSIGDYAFNYCSSLTSITVDANNKNYLSLDGVLFNKNKTRLIQYPIGNKRTKYSIPNSVTSIESSAFKVCDSLTSITIPNSVASIGGGAFEDCDSLTSITIPNSVTYIGDRVFNYCSSLTSITVDVNNKNYLSLDGVLFNKNKTRLIQYPIGNKRTKYSISNSVTSIESSAFEDCDSLTSITIPNSVTRIGGDAFYACRNLKNAYYLGSKNDWSKIDVYRDNSALTNALIYHTSHGYASPTWTWSGTSSATAKFTCACGAATNSKATISSSVTKSATCKSTGTRTYTAKVTFNGKTYTNKKTEIIAKIAHTYDKGKVTKKATCTATGVKTYTCTVCKVKKTTTIAKLKHTHKISITKATLSKDGKIVRNCKECKKAVSTTVVPKIKTITLAKTSYTYDGKVKTPSVTVKDSKGKTLKKDTDYAVSYSSSRKEVGTYTVKVTFKGNYSGSKSLTFKIVLGKVGGLKQMNKKGINFTWNKVAGATGYQVYTYNTKSKKYVLLGTSKGNTLGNSSAKGTMKIKVRAYRKVGKNTYYGAYSSVLTAKAK